ncbi:ras-related protein Rab-9A-like [Strongylocentrotus purpuratus]|uniref:small monomeric GTPase n=1 Tax=Strongylocentrotus purpuratus TaxID=7668 RepID=A0A7M7NHH1_STRPU|nr:ras-related protein Rab-9A [Strongylocentrotus purpuratus]XP_030836470.1 ras-related protein Rab-9A-like [Strongylocentrotus purpuratus]|eukprot:XP_003729379.1 PREDICTED: ras-related protein Rab-9A-like [Strongylocentrotus purpuratus]
MAGSRPMLLKVVILGDGGVGKSSLMNRFVSNKFEQESFHTIGVEFLNKDIVVEGETFTVQIWDTAGQERFKSLRTPFYRGSDCCMLTYGVDDRQSFHNLTMWKKEFLYYADIADGENFPFVLLGNKVDVESDKRQVGVDEAKQWCADNGNVPYYETSAKTAVNVEEAFIAAVRRVVELDRKNDVKDDVNPINLNQKPSTVHKKSDCC